MSRRITALTKRGIKSLHEGLHVDAILSFRHAIECLKTTVTATAAAHHEEQQQVQYDEECSLILRVPLSLSAPQDGLPQNQRSPHNIFDLYNCAFLLSPLHADVEIQHMEMSTVLFYNIALAHHIAGLFGHTNSCTEQHFQQALRYYKIFMTLVRFDSNQASLEQGSWHALILGALNNMGFLFLHTWQVDHARSCAVHMDLLLNNAHAVADHVQEEDFDFFVTAVTHTKYFEVAVAPAAWII